MKKPLKIWFDDKGNLLATVSEWDLRNSHNFKSEIASDFVDTMVYEKIVDYTRGASRVYMHSNTTHRRYSMYVEDFHDVIENKKFIDNKITGTFKLCKKGISQSIKLIL